MIKSNELRIGNWVKFTTEDKSFVSQIYQFNDGLTKVTSGTYSVSIGYPYKSVLVEPISLTEEILLKCGARRIDKYTFVLNGIFIHMRKIGFVFNVGKKKITIEHLHTLQNLIFALTGEELNYTP